MFFHLNNSLFNSDFCKQIHKVILMHFRPMMLSCYPDLDVNTLEKHIFRIFDKDGDGSIDFKEFMVILFVMTNGSAEENLKQIFRVFDIDRDGRISREEMYRICRDLSYMFSIYDNPNGHHPDEIGNMAFMEMDTNHDGFVSMEEFITACLNHEKISTMLALKIIDIFMPVDE